MTIWWVTLISTFLLCYLAGMFAKKPAIEGVGQHAKPNCFFAFLACATLIFVSGFRIGVGDTFTYKLLFDRLPNNFSAYLASSNFEGDWGFDFLQIMIKQFVKNDSQYMIFIFAFITLLLIFITLYRHSSDLKMAIFLFITTGCYLVSMNGVRQYFVSAVLFAAFPWIVKKKWYLYIPLVLIVSTIHQSALIFILVYFIANAEAWGSTTKWILAGGIGLYVTYPVTGPLIAKFLQETQYEHYGDALISTDSGANIIRVAVMLVPVLLSYMTKNKIKQNEKYFNIMVNMSVLNAVFILLATKYWIYARFNMYFTVYMIILMCWCIRYSFKDTDRSLVYGACLVLYTIFYWYEMAVSLNFNSSYVHFIRF